MRSGSSLSLLLWVTYPLPLAAHFPMFLPDSAHPTSPQDLHVTKLQPQMITLSESYIQIYERADFSVDHTTTKMQTS